VRSATALAFLALLAGCTVPGTGAGSTAGAGTPSASQPSSPPATVGASCTPPELGVPDPACTPGDVNPEVTPASLAGTACASGWTATIRPPRAYTDAVKRAMLGTRVRTLTVAGHTVTVRPYGPYAGWKLADYQLDHLVPLEAGGDPWGIANLWLEPLATAHVKDQVENAAKRAVCGGTADLAAVQAAFRKDWRTVRSVPGVPG
jgi:hypothetical protein